MINVEAETDNIDKAPAPNRVRLVQKDYESGEYGVMDVARAKNEFKGFSWDALMLEANAEPKTKWQQAECHCDEWHGWETMAPQNISMPWGSGGLVFLRAERELCAMRSVLPPPASRCRHPPVTSWDR